MSVTSMLSPSKSQAPAMWEYAGDKDVYIHWMTMQAYYNIHFHARFMPAQGLLTCLGKTLH